MQHIKRILLTFCLFGLSHGLWAQNDELIRVPGNVTGYGRITKDKIVDGAIVIPSLRAGDLLSFQIDQLIGPNEAMRAGPLTSEVPSNFHIPRQRENYGIFPITLEKEEFGVYLREGINEELSAIAFKAPFDELVDQAQNGAPFTRLLPLVNVQRLGYLGDRDWTQESFVDMSLNQELNQQFTYEWNRSTAPGLESDHLFVFQNTPLNRWTLSDLIGDVGTAGVARLTSDLGDNAKVLFLRTEDTNSMNYAQGYLRNMNAGGSLVVNGVPERLDAALEPSGLIHWSPINDMGWMMVVVKHIESNNGSFAKNLNLFGSFYDSLRTASSSFQVWASPSDGEVSLGTGTFDESNVSLVFIGTDHEVETPAPGDENPELFEAAQEIRIRKLL